MTTPTPITRARAFFADWSRALDRAHFAYHFDGGSLDDLLATLGRYQNDDGGFGHGLEPDITAPGSSPFATELALTLCLQADVPRDHPLLSRAVAYLEATQTDDGDWRFTPAVLTHDIAPWFAGWTWPNLNPGCTIAALLGELGLGSARLHRRAADLFDRLATPADLLSDQYYSVRPYAFYFLPETSHPQAELYRAGLLWWLIRQHHNNSLADAGHFFDYVRTPHSYTGRHLPPAIVAAQLDRLAHEQAADGGWPSPYAEHWRGWITAQSLLTLRHFGRI
jgi:hypothetical protein